VSEGSEYEYEFEYEPFLGPENTALWSAQKKVSSDHNSFLKETINVLN